MHRINLSGGEFFDEMICQRLNLGKARVVGNIDALLDGAFLIIEGAGPLLAGDVEID